MIWSVWSWTALTRSALRLFFRLVFAISISSIPASSSATIGCKPNSPPVMEPVGVVRDQPVVGLFLLEFDLGKRDLYPSVLISPVTDEPVLFVETGFFRIREPMDHDRDLL